MALVRCDFFSEVLEVGTLDDGAAAAGDRGADRGLERAARRDGDFPVLYLLHGLSDDNTAWLRYTSIERYAARARPRGRDARRCSRSFYADEAHGERLLDLLSEELPEVVGSFFRVSAAPRGHLRRRPVDGRLRRAEVGAAPARAVRRGGQPVRRAGPRGDRRDPARRASSHRVFDGESGPSDDLFDAARARPTSRRCRRSTSAAAPRTHLFDGNVRFVDAATPPGVDVTWTSGPASTSGGCGTR